MSNAASPGEFVFTFSRDGSYSITPPADFNPADWPVVDGLVEVVRDHFQGVRVAGS